jgi:hypothetical protein
MRLTTTIRKETLFSSAQVALMLGMTILAACAPAPTSHSVSVDQVVKHIDDPAMRQIWLEAESQHRLPPIDKIPVPDTPISHRQPTQVQVVESKPARPLIPKETVIAVQPFSVRQITNYQGPFTVVSHEAGVLKGKLQDEDTLLEIFYKLPAIGELARVQPSDKFHLIYRDDLVANAVQRRMILMDTGDKRTPLLYIAEGSSRPYRTVIEELRLTIEQTTDPERSGVIVHYGTQMVTLHEGETKSIGEGKEQLRIYLVNSYVQDKRYAHADEGQPYYVNIVMYQ